MLCRRFNLIHLVSCWASRHLCFVVNASDPVQRHASARQSRLPASRSANSVSKKIILRKKETENHKIRVIFFRNPVIFGSRAVQTGHFRKKKSLAYGQLYDYRINMKILRCVNKTEIDKIFLFRNVLELSTRQLSF